jgi:hypothetical protein
MNALFRIGTLASMHELLDESRGSSFPLDMLPCLSPWLWAADDSKCWCPLAVLCILCHRHHLLSLLILWDGSRPVLSLTRWF